MKKNSEEFNQIFVASFLKKLQLSGHDFLFWHTPNGGNRNKAEASKFKLMGVLSGVPDLTIAALDKMTFIEFKKSKTGIVSKNQNEVAATLNKYGFPVYFVSADNPQEAVQKVGDVMRDYFSIDQKSISYCSSSALGSGALKS